MASPDQNLAPLLQPSFGGLGRRLGAYLLDCLIAVSVVILAESLAMRGLRAVGLWNPSVHGADPVQLWRGLGASAKLAIVFGYFLMIGPIYLALFEASAWQASFGKRILSVYVMDNGGKRIGVARALGRSFSKVFLNPFGAGLVSMVTIAADKRKRAIHDFLASTVVVNGRPSTDGSLEPWRILVAFGVPILWIVGTFLVVL